MTRSDLTTSTRRVRTSHLVVGGLLALLTALTGAVVLSGPAAADYPTCTSNAIDPDGDGWGWENNQSCKVPSGSSSGSGSSSSSYPTCVSRSSDPDGDGWGWENNQSCRVTSSTGSGSSSTPTPTPTQTQTPTTSACPSTGSCGSYTVSGLGARKQQIRNAGGNTLDLAIAMLETDNMTTNYSYGDNKTQDAANFGIFKQNWGMLRVSCSKFKGQSQSQWNNGAALNSDLNADISCRHESENYYGQQTWFAGHRNGSSGLANPNTADINAYKTGVMWIKQQLDSNSANLTNDTRFWVNVPAI